MRERGYPVEDFDQRAEDLSVDHPDVVQNYRQGHRLATGTDRREETSTEDLRQAMWHYRALFEELVEPTETSGGPTETSGGPTDSQRIRGQERAVMERDDAAVDNDTGQLPTPVDAEDSTVGTGPQPGEAEPARPRRSVRAPS